ncbi:leukocyte immunoglobulin-like receptor subfamily B member 4A isoform X2 [Phascolarctos cinereus]
MPSPPPLAPPPSVAPAGSRGEGRANGRAAAAPHLCPRAAVAPTCSPPAPLAIMGPWLAALLFLDTLPKPQIIFDNGSVIPVGLPVSVRCRGPPEAKLFFLKKESAEASESTQPPVWNEARFSFAKMEQALTGAYSCRYQAGAGMSPSSESVNLAVSGVLPKPLLSASTNTQLASGQSVSFKCRSEHKLDRLIVYQDRGLVPPTHQPAQNSAVELRFSRIDSKYTGTFFCMGYTSKEPLVWSVPSDPVELTVLQSQDHVTGSLLLVVPLALGTLLS